MSEDPAITRGRFIERRREYDTRSDRLVNTLRSRTDERVRFDVEVEEIMSLRDSFRERVDRVRSATDREFLTATGQAEETEKRLRAKLDDVESRIATKAH